MSNKDFQKQLSRTLILLGKKTPFFAVLAMFTEFRETNEIDLAGTDGKDIFINPIRFGLLVDAQRITLVCHELIHAALLHVFRRQDRHLLLWNIAADIVVNGILDQEGFELLENSIRMGFLENETVEKVYEYLLENQPFDLDAFEANGLADLLKDNKTATELAAHWEQAMETASAAIGSIPGNMRREYDQRKRATELSWRDLLWRFLTPALHDYAGYDRRFVGRGLYLDTLAGESIKVALCIDTSGSIGKEELSLFQNEIDAILGAYPAIELILYYADTQVYGPYLLNSSKRDFPDPVGGGGTNFVPFFEEIARTHEQYQVAIYLTDGYGRFPAQPDLPVLWVMTPDGRDNVPFGQLVHL